jgi:hypothetical protein
MKQLLLVELGFAGWRNGSTNDIQGYQGHRAG